MSQIFALVRWCGGEDDKTFTSDIPVEWIRNFNSDKFSSREVYAVEWRNKRKMPKGGWELYDANVVAVSADCNDLKDKLHILECIQSPLKQVGNILGNTDDHVLHKAIMSKPASSSSTPLLPRAVVKSVHELKRKLPAPDVTDDSDDQSSKKNRSLAPEIVRNKKKKDNESTVNELTPPKLDIDVDQFTDEEESSPKKNTISHQNCHTSPNDFTSAENNSDDSNDSVNNRPRCSTSITCNKKSDFGFNDDNLSPGENLILEKLIELKSEVKKLRGMIERSQVGISNVSPQKSHRNKTTNFKDLKNSKFVEGDIEIGRKGSGIKVTDMQWVCATSKETYTSMATSLLVALFSEETLKESNYKGGISKVSKDGDKELTRKKALDTNIMEAIKYTVHEKFPSQYKESTFGQAINNKLAGIRANEKRNGSNKTKTT